MSIITIKFRFQGHIIGKPRMTQGDKRRNPPRPIVAQYILFKDHINIIAKQAGYRSDMIILQCHIQAFLPGIKGDHPGQRHHTKPDGDNIIKAVLDALTTNDSEVYSGGWEKYVMGKDGEFIDVSLTVIDIPQEHSFYFDVKYNRPQMQEGL